MISAGLEGRLPYMTYPEPWRGPPKQPPEFLRPAPKPVPPTSRYNGVNTSPNGMRLAPAQHSLNKYPSPPSISTPVNLTQHKDEIVEELPYYRLYATPHISHFPQFTTMYQSHYPPMIRSTFPTTSLQPLEAFSPTTPTAITSSTFLSPPSTFSPPSPVKSGQSVLRDKRITTQTVQSATQVQSNHQSVAFKVPTGKEGSLKHRILTRPEDGGRNLAPLDLQKPAEPRRRLNATMSPPRSPKKTVNNNHTILNNFNKGSLIQLTSGELRKIEDMRTEDFISSAKHSPELRLAESTVVRIEENPNGTATITLSYNQGRTQVEFESTIEHPFFVYGQGWASCNPERTQQCYRLKVHRLQVGDILISLTPREPIVHPITTRSTTIMTTATSTAMTLRPLPLDSVPKMHRETDQLTNSQIHPINLHSSSHPPFTMSPDNGLSVRKRSAPDQICDDEEQHSMRRHRIE